jgi:hypothetical protein
MGPTLGTLELEHVADLKLTDDHVGAGAGAVIAATDDATA